MCKIKVMKRGSKAAGAEGCWIIWWVTMMFGHRSGRIFRLLPRPHYGYISIVYMCKGDAESLS